jgi:predicted DNA binding CopG/RHH family protein
LAAADIDTARGIAAEKGIGYQTYIKMLLRDALRRETTKQ